MCEIAACYVKQLNTIVIVIYRSPHLLSIDHFLAIMFNVLQYIEKHYENTTSIILAGDFNIHMEDKSNLITNTFLQFMASFGLKKTTSSTTRAHGNHSSCLDNIFTNFNSFDADIVEMGFSDHSAQILELPERFSLKEVQNVTYKRKYSKNNTDMLNNYLSLENWVDTYNATTAEEKYNNFLDTFLYYYYICFPLQKCKQTGPKQEKLTSAYITAAKNRVMFLHDNYKQNPTEENKRLYNEYRKIYNDLLINEKQKHYQNLLTETDNYSKTVWSIIDKETGRKMKPKVISENLSADCLNKFFTTNAENIVSGLPASQTSPETLLNSNLQMINSVFFKPVIPDDIRIVIKEFKNKKTEDIHGINVCTIKSCANFIIEPLADVINSCLCEGHFPSRMKIGKVIPVHKRGDIDEPANYRQISVLPVFSKTLERVIYDQMILYFDSNNILCEQQYGFRKGCTTTSAVLTLIEYIHIAFENKYRCQGLFTDLSAAFDCVQHDILLNKLEFYGIRGRNHDLINSYLQNRSQIVVYEDISNTREIKRGVPQGSILGPLLFLVYINDLPTNLNIDNTVTVMYADDVTMGIMADNDENLQYLKNKVIEVSKNWYCCNRLCMNEDKTTTLTFKTRKSNDVEVTTKFLGVHVDESLTWQDHISQLCNKLSKAIYAIRKTRNFINEQAAKTTYYALFHSHISYATLIWGNAANVHLHKVFILQKSAVRAITGADWHESCKPIFVSLEIMSLYSLIVYVNLCYIKQHESKFTTHANIHEHDTRFKDNINIPKQRLQKTTIRGISLFNALPQPVRNMEMKKFKIYLKRFLTIKCLYTLDEYYLAVTQIDAPKFV